MLEFDPSLPETDDFSHLFLEGVPLLDVRAPVEFAEGAFPGAVNAPLIDDRERHEIGLTYKQKGQDAAIALGLERVAGERREARIAAWRAFAERHPDGVLYCFRGGLRSRTAQQWLAETGVVLPRVRGGYKAMRRFLIEQLESCAQRMRPVVIGGRTGVGKTRFIQRLRPHLDLERLAWHRGSAFGRHATPQPSQIDFENALAIALMRLVHRGNPYFAAEDESRNIGARHMPLTFFEPFSKAPVVVLEAPLEHRIDITLQEYVHDTLAEYRELLGEEAGFTRWADGLRDSLDRIRKRLGGERHARVRRRLDDALELHARRGDTEGHRAWIRVLLCDYYDAMYGYQLERKRERIVFTGDHEAVSEYLSSKYGITN